MTSEETLQIASAIDEDTKYDIAIALTEAYCKGYADATAEAVKILDHTI